MATQTRTADERKMDRIASLRFVRDDATEAAYYGAIINNPKTTQYLREASEAIRELNRLGVREDLPAGKFTVYYSQHDMGSDDGRMVRPNKLHAAQSMWLMRQCGYGAVTCEESTNN